MEPRHPSQPWPGGKVPAPAWTKTIQGNTYTVKRINDDELGIWREAEELGTFRLQAGGADELRASYADDLSLEARAVVNEFIETSRSAPEGPAKREPEGSAERDS
jgi:hypothetical protein